MSVYIYNMSYAKATAPKTAQDYKTELFELKKRTKRRK